MVCLLGRWELEKIDIQESIKSSAVASWLSRLGLGPTLSWSTRGGNAEAGAFLCQLFILLSHNPLK